MLIMWHYDNMKKIPASPTQVWLLSSGLIVMIYWVLGIIQISGEMNLPPEGLRDPASPAYWFIIAFALALAVPCACVLASPAWGMARITKNSRFLRYVFGSLLLIGIAIFIPSSLKTSFFLASWLLPLALYWYYIFSIRSTGKAAID